MATEEERDASTKDEVKNSFEPQGSQGGADKIKILVVEDDRTTLLLYDKGLFNQIFDKKMVVSGKEAILVYDEWHPDIIVLDIYLPEMTGYQVLKAIRTKIGDKKTTIVMATSLSGSEDIMSCMKLGIEGYIVKPFQCMEIGAKLLSYYAKKEPERARETEAQCREIAKQSQAKLFLDKHKPMTKIDKENANDRASSTGTEESGGTKEGEMTAG